MSVGGVDNGSVGGEEGSFLAGLLLLLDKSLFNCTGHDKLSNNKEQKR